MRSSVSSSSSAGGKYDSQLKLADIHSPELSPLCVLRAPFMHFSGAVEKCRTKVHEGSTKVHEDQIPNCRKYARAAVAFTAGACMPAPPGSTSCSTTAHP